MIVDQPGKPSMVLACPKRAEHTIIRALILNEKGNSGIIRGGQDERKRGTPKEWRRPKHPGRNTTPHFSCHYECTASRATD